MQPEHGKGLNGRLGIYRVTFPVRGVWHRLGAAWINDGGTINVVLDVGVPITLQPGNKLVLVPRKEGEAE
jgi:hypothetical protein